MGCLFGRSEEKDSESVKKVYSWDSKKNSNFDKNNYILESLVNREIIRLPGSVNGQQFLIQNCKNSTIYILDHMNTVSIYDCIDCKIIIGPVKGSVYIGGCQNCICVMACGQLRLRDSRKITLFVHSETQPAIEASSAISIGSYKLIYNSLEDHLKKADLNVKRKNWKFVHDFTPMQGETNWKFIENDNPDEFVKNPVFRENAEMLRSCGQSWQKQEEQGPPSCLLEGDPIPA